MFKSLFFGYLLFTLSIFANAQTKFIDKPEETKKIAEEIAASIATGNIPRALKELNPFMPINAAEFTLLEAQLATQTGNFLRQIGSPFGYEYIRSSTFGINLIRHQLSVLHEKAPLRVNIVFYKGEKGWFITHFNFDVNAQTFFD
jgi:hypothetical protein